MRKLLVVLIIGVISVVNGFGITEEAESKNDYYKNEDFKKVVDAIIKNYGEEEAINAINYCSIDAAQKYSHDKDSYLFEVSFYSCITGTDKTMKYRREDYCTVKSSSNSKKELISGITYNGKEIVHLPKSSMGSLGLEKTVNKLFDLKYSFVSAFTTRLKDRDYAISYKGKLKDKDLAKDVLAIELKDTDPETLGNRESILYYNPSSYLLEAISFDDVLPDKTTTKILFLIKSHGSKDIMCDKTKKAVKYISKISIKERGKSGQADIEIKNVSFDKFDESVFNPKEQDTKTNISKPTESAGELLQQAQELIKKGDVNTAKLKLQLIIKYYPNDPMASAAQQMLDKLPK